jgi:hypothetical protein
MIKVEYFMLFIFTFYIALIAWCIVRIIKKMIKKSKVRKARNKFLVIKGKENGKQ